MFELIHASLVKNQQLADDLNVFTADSKNQSHTPPPTLICTSHIHLLVLQPPSLPPSPTIQPVLKGIVHPKMKILSLITHPHVVPIFFYEI